MDGAQVFEMLTQRGWTFEQFYRVPGNPQSEAAGWRAINALSTAYGDAVVPSAVGKIYRL